MRTFYRAIAVILILAGTARADDFKEPRGGSTGKVERMMDFIMRNKDDHRRKNPASKHAEKEFSLTEAEVNDYLQNWIRNELTRGRHKEFTVKSATVRLEAGHVIEADAIAQVGVGSLKLLDSAGESLMTQMLKQSLTIDNSLHVKCVVVAVKGKGFLDVQEVRIKNIGVPVSFVREILKIVGEKQRPVRDFTKPWDLPNGIEKIEVLPQALKLRIAIMR